MEHHTDLTLYLGGTRSGKSARAEAQALRRNGPVLYVATAAAHADDEAMQELIESIRIRGQLTTVKQLTGTLTGEGNIRGQLTLPKGKASPAFPGAYEYTPSNVMQMIEIEGYKATQNIVIHPIPQNYGLITWNGLGIKIS